MPLDVVSYRWVRPVRKPAAFPWPTATYPLRTIWGSRGRHSLRASGRGFFTPSFWAPTRFIHVDQYALGASDSTSAVVTNPLDRSKPALSLGRAVTLANAASAGSVVHVYVRGYGDALPYRGSANQIFSVNRAMSFMAWGDRARVIHSPSYTWTKDGTYTNCWTTSASNVGRVLDRATRKATTLLLRRGGVYTDLVPAASLALCNSTPGTWFVSGGLLYVNRLDGAAVTDANTAVTLSDANMINHSQALDLYFEGFDFEGGFQGCFRATGGAARVLVAEDSSFRYPGTWTGSNVGDAVQMIGSAGLTAFIRADASGAMKDGFNVHGGPTCNMLTVECEGYENGGGVNQSNNGLTSHDGCIAADINGSFGFNRGGNVHAVTGAKHWCVGTLSEFSQGDVDGLGGGIDSAGFIVGLDDASGSAQMFLDNTLSRGNIRALSSRYTGSLISARGHQSSGGIEETIGGGAIALAA